MQDELARGSTIPGSGPDAATGDDLAELSPGTRVGRFEIERCIGRGGMGVVYLARDTELARKIAVKFIRGDFRRNDPTIAARLFREARAAAALDHANVIGIYDVGFHGQHPWVAMEYVDGQTLRSWLDERPRSQREILSVFAAVARGLAAAHRAGLVHRDMKPENILIGADRIRVADFGLARLDGDSSPGDGGPGVAAPATGSPGALTAAGAIMGTPRYMSPEQRAGQPTDARGDQYSFCVALYEALHGKVPPFEGPAAAAASSRAVPGWLGGILARGLAQQPDDRYPRLDDLLADLEGKPRTRRRVAVVAIAAAAAVVAVGAAGIGLAAWPGSRGGTSCADAAAGRLTAVWSEPRRQELRDALLATARPGATETWSHLEAAIDRRAGAWAASRVDTCEATRVRGEQSEALLDLRVQCLDRRLDELGALVGLLARDPGPALDRAVEAVHALPGLAGCADREALAAAVPPPDDPVARARIDDARHRLAGARARFDTGAWNEAAAELRPIGEEADRLAYPPLRAEVLLLRYKIEDQAGDAARAEATLRELGELAAQARDDRLAAQAWIGRVIVVGQGLRRFEAAAAAADAAHAAVLRVHDPLLSADLDNARAMVLNLQGSYAEAAALYRQVIATRSRHEPGDSSGLANALDNLGIILQTTGELEEARRIQQEALAMRRRLLGPRHPLIATSLNNLANTLGKLGKLDEAQAQLEQAVALRRLVLGPEHPLVADSLNNLASVQRTRGDLAAARLDVQESIRIKRKAYGDHDARLASSLNTLGNVLNGEGRLAEAQVAFEEALDIYERKLGAGHVNVGLLRFNLANLLVDRGKPGEALARYQEARAILDKALGPDHEHVAVALAGIGTCTLLLGDARGAIAPLERALAALAPKSGSAYHLANTRYTLARALWQAGTERRRALQLARAARDGLAASEEAQASGPFIAEIDAWLAARR